MNKKGQALVEFIIILPVIIFIIMMIIDFMMIFAYKNELENDMNNIVKVYNKNKEEVLNITDNIITIKEENKYINITISKNYQTITPGLSLILGNPYEIKCERVILNEQ